ncbi:hypothetical protein D9R08_18235 [Rhodophyticola porphyridii]|uniref:Uncharacterized protein n=1 Tax=Rhodophyticola porphyridii TaxID=1852017 RepID=A0A3L9YCJ0_9RHOB|nr:hypothetical protein D9R08_18235 [Rhodophyticola porphyridii]
MPEPAATAASYKRMEAIARMAAPVAVRAWTLWVMGFLRSGDDIQKSMQSMLWRSHRKGSPVS